MPSRPPLSHRIDSLENDLSSANTWTSFTRHLDDKRRGNEAAAARLEDERRERQFQTHLKALEEVHAATQARRVEAEDASRVLETKAREETERNRSLPKAREAQLFRERTEHRQQQAEARAAARRTESLLEVKEAWGEVVAGANARRVAAELEGAVERKQEREKQAALDALFPATADKLATAGKKTAPPHLRQAVR